jgi:Nif-specific regulatory protein
MTIDTPTRELRELSLLFDISTRLSGALDLKTVLKPILEITAEHMGILRGTLTVLNRKKGEIAIEEAYGLRPEEKAKGRYRLGEGVTGRVIDTGRPAIVPDISKEPRFLDRTGSREHLDKGGIAFICVPIKNGNEVIGAISADRPAGLTNSLENDVRLLTIIGSSISQAVRLRQAADEELEKARQERERLRDELKNRYRPKAIVGASRAMRHLYFLIERVRRTNATVLILGESGVGKERVARAIHYNSDRADKPFVVINCAALPQSLIESELFGHEKGAFTGAAAARPGRFELAHGGTVFLDEVGDLPQPVQTKLLRVLQEREFERIGGNSTMKVDVRIIAATNRDLVELMKEGRFREDLYFRLNIFPIVVPPLRERKPDIMLLAGHFIEKYGKEHGKQITAISKEASAMLREYHWPGNVRELENCIERALILCTDGVIHGLHLPPNLQTGRATRNEPGRAFKEHMTHLEREIIMDELKRSWGNMARAARALGITERVMGLRVAAFGIDTAKFKQKRPESPPPED